MQEQEQAQVQEQEKNSCSCTLLLPLIPTTLAQTHTPTRRLSYP